MTDERSAADEVVQRWVVLLASRLEQQIRQISDTIQARLEEQIPELGTDARMIAVLAASVESNLMAVIGVLLHGTEVDQTDVPKPAMEYARLIAQQDLPINTLVRAYRLGQRHLTELVFAELRALDVEPNTRVAVIEAVTTVVLEYVDRVSATMVAEYEDERGHWLENQNSIRAMRVRDILADTDDVDVETASAAIGYPLDATHLALILWYQGANAGDELTRLQEFTDGLAGVLGASAGPLFAAAAPDSAWVWLPFQVTRGDLTAEVREYASARPDSMNIAIGALGSGVEGFRRSHRQAQRVRAAVLAHGSELPARIVAAATDSDMMTAALLGTDIAEVRGWVADVLGGLATDTDDDAVLRETLRLFLNRGSTHEAAARQLGMTFNMLRNRVERAVARRGRPIDDRVDVELALFVCHWYGSAVLRPS
ncbi:hypothetical protein A5634_22055 [Mycobacterium asiaticum]|uniref:Uncharacterized protein n=1 Tax=Mycobacterium asiaticum TaxID=1790 RepID=A0A1A3P3E7_MYCAS|nr:hypothetical protein [Mycobacterium asiaticum]OBK27804.1 hypothetical protein A5634_22055 [Mycobacterium asiaticum]